MFFFFCYFLISLECAAKGGTGGSVIEHHPSSYWEQPFSQPYFDNSTKRETTTTVGQSAYLYCRVRNLGDRAVSPYIYILFYSFYFYIFFYLFLLNFLVNFFFSHFLYGYKYITHIFIFFPFFFPYLARNRH